MSGWEPGATRFPQEKTEKIPNITYIGELVFAGHAKVHLHTPKSL
jgi:hypothetical protein